MAIIALLLLVLAVIALAIAGSGEEHTPSAIRTAQQLIVQGIL